MHARAGLGERVGDHQADAGSAARDEHAQAGEGFEQIEDGHAGLSPVSFY